MPDSEYNALIFDAFRRVVKAFDHVDTDDADLDQNGDVVTIKYRDGVRAVLNTQRPTQQIWLAGAGHAWHFSFVASSAEWRDDRRPEEELFAVLARLCREHGGITVDFSPPAKATSL